MREFFARLYEWFGLIPLYSKDLDEFLRGLDNSCTAYLALPWYAYMGGIMIAITVLVFMLQYDLIDSRRFKKLSHWALAAFMIFAANFMIAFAVPAVAVLTHAYCPLLQLSFTDCIGFGISNAVWSFVLFGILSAFQEIRQSRVNGGQ